MTFTFTGLGGVNEIGASSYLYGLGPSDVLIDAGVRPGTEGTQGLPALAQAEPTLTVLTHAHLDHSGALPLIRHRFPDSPILCTQPTAQLVKLVLHDALRIQQLSSRQVFTEDQVQDALRRLTVVPYHQPVPFRGGSIELLPAGHLLGAASVLLRTPQGTLLHTGDFSTTATHTTHSVHLPAEPQQVRAVITESTYGDQNLPPRKEQIRALTQKVAEITRRGGSILIPSFALGRAQELIVILVNHMLSGAIPTVPIVLDGLVRDVTRSYENLLEHLPAALQNHTRNGQRRAFLHEPVQVVETNYQREKIIHGGQPCIVIASSGMLQAGVSPLYARHWLPEQEHAVLLVGFQDADSPGRLLTTLQPGSPLALPAADGSWVDVPVNCQVDRFQLSAHADRNGILKLLSRYPGGKVIPVHGEATAQQGLRKALSGKRQVELLRNLMTVEL